MNRVITISRQFGSGGREIGKRLADELAISYYDKEIIEMVSRQSGISKDIIEQFSESAVTRLYPITIGETFNKLLPKTTDEIYSSQSKAIIALASTRDCVIVGRCADFVLKHKNPLKVFIFSSDIQFRLDRCYTKAPMGRPKNTRDMQIQMHLVETQRLKYYEHYTKQNWSNMQNYNLCIDTSSISIKQAVKIIIEAFNR